jgi:S-adenosylmethionine decarboxylase
MGQIFFEGPEKKFEIILKDSSCALRQYGKEFWSRIVDLAGANILSILSNQTCDAYLLSESSLFVYDDRVIMITCGQTTLAKSLVTLLKFISRKNVQAVYYERKKHFFPDDQPYDFSADRKYIGKHLPVKEVTFGQPDENYINMLYHENGRSRLPNDFTLELLMHGIDPTVAPLFRKGAFKTRYDFYKSTGICDIVPGFSYDDYFFDPVGYSLNAINENEYYTFHVTPEEGSSYTSFETNHVFKNPRELQKVIKRVISLFHPEKFDLVLYCNTPDCAVPDLRYYDYSKVQEHADFFSSGYTVTYQTYSKEHMLLKQENSI